MANRTHYGIQSRNGNEHKINVATFAGNATSSPTVFNDLITSVSRSGTGTFAVVLRDKYPTEIAPVAYIHGTTAGLTPRVSAWDSAAGTMTVVTERAGTAASSAAAWTTGVAVSSHTATLGTAGFVTAVHATTQDGITPEWTSGITVTAHAATLAFAGHVVAVHATTQDGIVPAWTTGVAVASHTVTLAFAGYVTAVEATAAASTGVKEIQNSAAPAAGFVRVEYSASGVATLTFEATDAVTACAVQVVRPGFLHQGKRIISTGTPQPGEVKVEYTAGVAALTFATADNVTVAAAAVVRPGVLHQGKRIISTGTPQPGEVKVEYTAGVATLTFATADNVTVASVARDAVQSATTAAVTDPATTDTIVIEMHVRNSSYARP